MSVPDNELIAEVLLVSEGFRVAKDLARKMVALFRCRRGWGGCGCSCATDSCLHVGRDEGAALLHIICS